MVDIFKQLVTTMEARDAVKTAEITAHVMAEHCDARLAEKDAMIARLSAELEAAREALESAQNGFVTIAAYVGNPTPTRSKAGERAGSIRAVLAKLSKGA